MTTITLLIFSGRPNPQWILTGEEVTKMIQQLGNPGNESELSTLGYGGFLVESDDPGMPLRMIVRHCPRVERFLLQTGQRHLSHQMIRIVEEAIK